MHTAFQQSYWFEFKALFIPYLYPFFPFLCLSLSVELNSGGFAKSSFAFLPPCACVRARMRNLNVKLNKQQQFIDKWALC